MWCNSSSSFSWHLLSDGGPSEEWTPSGCCSQREYAHPPTVYQQKSASAGQGECLEKVQLVGKMCLEFEKLSTLWTTKEMSACTERDIEQHVKLNWQIKFSKCFLDCTKCLHLKPFDIQNNECHWYFSSVCLSKDFCNFKALYALILKLKKSNVPSLSWILALTFSIVSLGSTYWNKKPTMNLKKSCRYRSNFLETYKCQSIVCSTL